MTLTQLAQKHNLEPESAKAFLREWLDVQHVIGYTSISELEYPFAYPLLNREIGDRNIPVFARPTDLGD